MYRSPNTFTPRVDVKILPGSIEVRDNGIGMTADDLKDHFWRAGASGKNNVEAISAGVVGTFGIGGLANFGVCQRLTVVTESASNNTRTMCKADKNTLSLDQDCISIENLTPLSEPGTMILAELPSGRTINVKEATNYLKTFVEHVPIPIYINDEQVSMKPLEDSCSIPDGTIWSTEIKQNTAASLECDLKFKISESGIIWIEMEKIRLDGNRVEGRVLLKQGIGQIMAFRSGFGLSRTGVYSVYSFGGVADLKVLQPTAGRDALTNASVQVLQTITSSAEQMIAPIVADSPYTDMNTYFMGWAAQRKRFDLLGNLKVSLLPTGKKMSLKEVSDLSNKIYVNYYNGPQESVARELATEETPLIHIARSNPRGRCEVGYLEGFTKAHLVSGDPRVIEFRPDTSWNREEAALAFKIGQVIGSDYFLPVQIKFGKISHNLPLLVNDDVKPPVLTLDSSNSTIQTLLQCYTSDFFVFNSYTKDFVRTIVFPRVSHLVPSSTREGAEAFLSMLRRQRDVFEYDPSEIRQVDEVIADFAKGAKGSVTLTEAIDAALNAVRKQKQVVSVSDVKKVTSIMPDIVSNQQVLEAEEEKSRGINYSAFPPRPAIFRNEVETDAKILVLEDSEIMFGYKGLLRLSEKAYADRAEFFYQPHYTEIIWGGQRIIFIFRHLSGTFGFYYDVQLNELMAIPSGGASYETMTLVLKNSVFLPIPLNLFQYFAPHKNEKKKFDVRYDILYPES
jgi:molecular chaperone HtpG